MFIVNVEGAIRKGDQWLIIKRSQKEEHAGGLLSLVGGKVETDGNSTNILETTLKREIYEEVGVTVKDPLHYVHSASFMTGGGDHVVNIIFACDYESGEAVAKSADEVESIYWLTTDEIINHPNAPIYLKEYINYANEVVRNVSEGGC